LRHTRSRCLVGTLLLALLPAARATAAPLEAWQTGPAGDLSFQTSAFMRTNAYPRPNRVGIHAAPDGAYGLNIAWEQGQADHWLIEEQRFAFDAIVAGLAYHRQDLLDRGEAIFDWGFRHERADGSFACADAFHSTSFFVEAAAHAALLIGASDMAAGNRAWVEAVRPQLRASARWMMRPEVARPGQQEDDRFGHRFYLDAAALGETGVLLQDRSLIRAAQDYVRRGLARQDPSGFNPERGGSDTSYQAVGLLLAETYYTLVADENERVALGRMIGRGLQWLAARTRPDGTVDPSGNTRTGPAGERSPQGKPKTMSYGSAYRAAYYWAMIGHDPHWAALADALHHGQEVENARRQATTSTAPS
jgi:hypothetical protein